MNLEQWRQKTTGKFVFSFRKSMLLIWMLLWSDKTINCSSLGLVFDWEKKIFEPICHNLFKLCTSIPLFHYEINLLLKVISDTWYVFIVYCSDSGTEWRSRWWVSRQNHLYRGRENQFVFGTVCWVRSCFPTSRRL